MTKAFFRTAGTVCALALLLSLNACHRQRKTTSAPNTTDYSDNIESLVAENHLAFLHWPNITDYQPLIKTFYDDRNYEIAWTRDGKPTPASFGFMQAFKDAGRYGLRPEDYDASRWDDLVQMLSPKEEEAVAQFDVAMTVSVMRFISDLRIGRVNPQHFNFDINVAQKKYDLAEFVSDNAVDVTDVPALLKKVEPDSALYRRTEEALAHYIDLAKQQRQRNDAPLDELKSTITMGQPYAGAPQLLTRLQLEGDMEPTEDASQPSPTTYTKALSEGVKAYQHRHGLAEDGKLTPQTVASLNVPLADRVKQLQNTLERWRWLPEPYINPRLMVNLPEFVLRAYTTDNQLNFVMKVVVGKVIGEHQTPVFAHMMKYIVFRPYWNVPADIARKELVPHIQSNRTYLESKNFEVINTKGQPVSYTPQQVAQGAVMVREKPGPKNSLGLVKFMFPNQYDIYLHSTPATELFNRTRRDFSHGCVRVQEPEQLAAWILQDQNDKNGKPWDLESVHQAMNSGPDNYQVNLKTPLPIVIFYMTAEVEEDGHVHFFDDIYGYDANLEKVLEKGPPYPMKPDPIAISKPKSGDKV